MAERRDTYFLDDERLSRRHRERDGTAGPSEPAHEPRNQGIRELDDVEPDHKAERSDRTDRRSRRYDNMYRRDRSDRELGRHNDGESDLEPDYETFDADRSFRRERTSAEPRWESSQERKRKKSKYRDAASGLSELGREIVVDYDDTDFAPDDVDKELATDKRRSRTKRTPRSDLGSREDDDYGSDSRSPNFDVSAARMTDKHQSDDQLDRIDHNNDRNQRKKRLRRRNSSEHVAAAGIAKDGYDNGGFELRQIEGPQNHHPLMGIKNSTRPLDAGVPGEGSRVQGQMSESAAGGSWARPRRLPRDGGEKSPSFGTDVSTIDIGDGEGSDASASRPRTGLAVKRLRRAGPLTEDDELNAILGDAKAAARLRDQQRAQLKQRATRMKATEADKAQDVNRQYGDLYRQTL